MTRRKKKEIERWILERFLESLGQAAPGLPSSFVADESPDFVMDTLVPCPLGIEIVELNHVDARGSGLCLRQEEGIQEDICRMIEQRWNSATMPIAEVSLYFLGHRMPQKHEYSMIADAILEIVRTNMPEEEGVSNVSRDDLWEHPVLGQQVQSLSVARWSGLDRPYITAPRTAFLPPLSHKLLQAAFEKKNRKADQYRARCQKVWLVAVHNNTTLSTHFSPDDSDDSDLSDSYDLSFDRTFVFDVIRKKSIEIKRHNKQPHHTSESSTGACLPIAGAP